MSVATRLIIGAMSGTSADGVDVAITRITGRGMGMSASLVRHHSAPYESSLKSRIIRLRQDGHSRFDELAEVGRLVSIAYSRAVVNVLGREKLAATDITAIAAHGQTLFHRPPDTIQWLDPSLIAHQTGIAVVSDFRRADCAAGGQGAPLVPFADYLLFRHATKNRVLLNIGGIANLTWLRAGGTLDEVIAFDTGPGNCIIDHLCRLILPDGPGYDINGSIARQVPPLAEPLRKLLTSEWIRKPPPKSTDGPAMIELFNSVENWKQDEYLDRVSTATAFTACAIQQSIAMFLPGKPDELIVSGGGIHNVVLMEYLRKGHGAVPTLTTDELGIPSQAKEAVAFALLGAATLDGFPSNVPSVTGARCAVVLGSVTRC